MPNNVTVNQGDYNWSVEMEKVGHKMENSSDFIKNFPF